MASNRWVSVEEIAEHLGVSKDTVYRWIDKRSLPAHRTGRLWKFQLVEVDEWVKSGGKDSSNGSSDVADNKMEPGESALQITRRRIQ